MIRNTQESFEAKAKGENYQQDLVRLREAFPQHADSIRSTPMSAHGEDIQILTPEARQDIPFSFEAKFREKGFIFILTTAPIEQAARQEHAVSSALSNILWLQFNRKDLTPDCHVSDDLANLSIIRAYTLANTKRSTIFNGRNTFNGNWN